MFKLPEKWRNKDWEDKVIKHKECVDGPPENIDWSKNGCFIIPAPMGMNYACIAAVGKGWEHVSVHMFHDKQLKTPTWDEMCHVKDMFWSKEDTVLQFHPSKSNYINIHNHTLHLWRPIGIDFPMPPQNLV